MSKLDANEVIQASFPETLLAGAVTVGTSDAQISATHVALASGVWIKAAAGNSGVIYVGKDSAVDSTSGYPLAAGESVFVAISDLSKVFLISGSAGQDVRYIAS